MKRLVTLVALSALVAVGAGAQSLAPGSELLVPTGWTGPVTLEVPGPGGYRLELTASGQVPVVVAEKRGPQGRWEAAATNRGLGGAPETSLDLTATGGDSWRVRPQTPLEAPVVLGWKRIAFAGFNQAVQQGLTSSPGPTDPLNRRTRGVPAPDVTNLTAAAGPGGRLWGAWLTDGGRTAEVWDLGAGTRLGSPLTAPEGGPWVSATLVPDTTAATLSLEGPGGQVTLVWTGVAWSGADAQPTPGTQTPWGRILVREATPVDAWRAGPLGWEDLGLPRDDRMDRVLWTSTDDGVFVFLASSQGPARAAYSWRPGEGWVARPVPEAAGPPVPGLWALASAGSLELVEGRGPSLILRQFDGTQWRTGLDLSSLAPDGAQAVALVGPSAWSKTGTLVLAASGRVCVYDLP